MTTPIRRRSLLAAPVAIAAAHAAAQSAAQTASQATAGSGPVAVVYLSRSGNTRVVAGALSRRFDAPLLEIRPRDPWPEDYEAMVQWASDWRTRRSPMPLAQMFDLGAVQTVYLGFPIWGTDLPAPMRSFVSAASLDGKTVRPFVTHGGYGPGSALGTLGQLTTDAQVGEPFVLRCDQERDTLNQLDGWLAD